MLTTPFHAVTCYELPVYFPSEEERRDPKAFAAGVRRYMVRTRLTVVCVCVCCWGRCRGRGWEGVCWERCREGAECYLCSCLLVCVGSRCALLFRALTLSPSNIPPLSSRPLPAHPQLEWGERLGVGLAASDATLEDKRRYQADLKLRLAAAAGGGSGGGGGGGGGGGDSGSGGSGDEKKAQ